MVKDRGIYKRKNIWWVSFTGDGRQIRESSKSTNKKVAEKLLAKRRVEVAENRFLDIRKSEKIKFEDFAYQEFIERHSKPYKKSWQSDLSNLKSLAPFFKGKYLYEITAKDIAVFIQERAKVVKPATVNRELATIKTLFNKAIEWGKLERSPAKAIRFLKEPNGRVRFLEREEITRLISNCPAHLRPIVIVAIHTGMRRGEILGLKWHDIDFKRDIIRLTDTKNNESRAIPMNEVVKETLIAIPKHPQSPYIFCEKDGKPYHDLRKSFSTALKRSAIIDFRFHDLRHTCGAQLVMSGIDLRTVQEILGHKDLRMTVRYTHLSQDHKRRAVDILGKYITISAQSPKIEIPEKLNVSELLENIAVK